MSDKNKKIIGSISVLALIAVIAVSIQSGGMRGLNGRNLVDIEPAAGEMMQSEDAQVSPAGQSDVNDNIEHITPFEGGEPMVSEGYNPDHNHDHGEFFDWDYEPPEITQCGVYEHWIAKPLDEEAIKATEKVYRIIRLGDRITMDYNPERINVYLNQNDLVLDVKCG